MHALIFCASYFQIAPVSLKAPIRKQRVPELFYGSGLNIFFVRALAASCLFPRCRKAALPAFFRCALSAPAQEALTQAAHKPPEAPAQALARAAAKSQPRIRTAGGLGGAAIGAQGAAGKSQNQR